MAKSARKVAGTASAKVVGDARKSEKAARPEAKTDGAAKHKVGKSGKVGRSNVTGRFVGAGTASRHPRTTVTESTAITGRYVAPQTAPRRPAPVPGNRGSKRFAVGVTEHQHGLPGVAQAELDRVLAEVRLVWAGNAAMTWMTSANARLEGNRPLDVLAMHGPDPVLEALEAGAWGGAS